MNVPLLMLDESIAKPTYATRGSVGFDISTVAPVEIDAGAVVAVGTGLVIATPPGWSLLVSLRSSTPTRFGVIQPHGVGIVDPDYRGPEDEIHLQLMNVRTSTTFIPAHTRIAQGIFVRVAQAEWTDHDPAGDSRGGFGSTN
jgi:dUTP pyrophosphatase